MVVEDPMAAIGVGFRAKDLWRKFGGTVGGGTPKSGFGCWSEQHVDPKKKARGTVSGAEYGGELKRTKSVVHAKKLGTMTRKWMMGLSSTAKLERVDGVLESRGEEVAKV